MKKSLKQYTENYENDLTSTQVHLPDLELMSNFIMHLQEEKGALIKELQHSCNKVYV